MNKKLFLGMFAAAGMLLATSCSNDELDAVQSGNEARVSFSLGLEGGIATRAISDGTGADKLVYAVFDKDGNRISTIAAVEKDKVTFPATETLTLAKGQTYKVAFWAQDTDCDAYTVDTETMSVSVDYEGINNDETRDAFFKTETFTVSGNTEIKVVLKRPFAQINVGVTKDDWEAAVASGITIKKSSVVIKNAATSINLLDGSVSGETEVSYSLAAIPTETLEVETDATKEGKEKYTYLSMSYILANETQTGYEKATLEGLSFTFNPQTGKNPIVFNEGLTNVPVQRNWRTNILGQLLTGTINFNITIDPIYDGDHNIINGTESTNEIAPGVTVEGNTYRISSAAGLGWLSDVVNGTATTANGYAQDFTQSNFSGKTVVLTNDIDLTNVDWTPISDGCKVGGDGLGQAFSGTFDGGNHTISNMTVDGEEYVGLFAKAVGTIKNVKMTDVNIKGTNYAGAVIGYIYGTVENCHVDGGSILITTKDGDLGDKAGGIVGYLGEGNGVVKDNSVKNLTVTAYRDVAGIVGCAQTGATITNNRVDNVAVIADMLQDGGKTVADANAGKIVGRNIANADLTSNTVNNVTVNVYAIENGVAKAGTANGLAYALTEGMEVVMQEDITKTADVTAPYGNKLGYTMNGGTLDGNGYELTINNTGDDYGIMTTGGTIKNLTITEGCRAIMLMNATEDVILENVNIGGDGVLYPINTGEKGTPENVDLIVKNSTLAGWTSFNFVNSASFTNVTFKQGTYYNNIYGRVVKPYVNTTFTDCSFIEHMNLDLSALAENNKVTIKNCKVNGQAVTKSVFSVPSSDADYDTALFSVDLPDWAESITDCVTFE